MSAIILFLFEERLKVEIKRGDICYCKLNGVGSVQKHERPCVVVSNDKANQYSPVITVAPITSKTKNTLPTHVMIELNVLSCIMLEQITTIDKSQVKENIGSCTPELIEEIEQAMLTQLAMKESTVRQENRKLRKKLLEYERLLIQNSLLSEKEEEREKIHRLKPNR